MAPRETQSSETLTDLSASELIQTIKAGDLSAREVTEAHIRRIEAIDKRLNAVVITLFDEARAQAIEADKVRSRGELLGPLHGVPVTIKEQYRVASTETTIGLTGEVGKKYDSDGPLVAKLRQAGAIILGKTNIMQTLAGWESDNPVYGRTNNPWNLDRTPGGSSGGDAAIIAARGAPLGLGGDLGGSVRVPAHFCGIHGLKPTSGRLTNEDVPMHLFPTGQEAILAQPGPMARTVADLRLAMDVLAAPSPRASVDLVPPVPWLDPAKVQIDGLRIGTYTDDGFFPASPAIRRAVEEAAEALRAIGAQVEPFAIPDAAEAVGFFLGILTADGGASLRRVLGNDKPIRQLEGTLKGAMMPNALRPVISKLMEWRGQEHLAWIIRHAGRRSAGEYWDLVEARNGYRARFLDALDRGRFDAVLGPPFALPALTHGSSEHLFAAASYALLYNVLGMPAGVVAATRVQPGEESDRSASRDLADRTAREVERNSAGLPVGVQVVGRHWREDVVLAVMAGLEEHFRTKPNYPAWLELAAC
jgi:fatty acid amide hydrolase